MTSSTRGRLMICLIVGLITLPVEALLLPIARTPDPAAAAVEWTQALSSQELQTAAQRIDAYPAQYRRAIMGELDGEARATVWRSHFQRYLDEHPSLTPEQRAVVQDAIALASANAFVPPVAPEVRERISSVFNRALVALGKDASNDLFVTLGPKQLRVASALPLTQRLADSVRSWRVASADAPDCNCNVDIDTCDFLDPDPWLRCSEQYTCNFDLDWPMCGPLWSWACTGWCKIVRWPSDMD